MSKGPRPVSKFIEALLAASDARMDGVDARGNKQGAMNQKLNALMADVRVAGDLKGMQRLHEDCLAGVKRSMDRLIQERFAPRSSAVDLGSIRASWQFLNKQSTELSNQALLKLLAGEAKVWHELRPYYNFVVRMWLLSPPESVVESMGSVAENVFGTHRQLDHRNAAMELQVRWNGPTVFQADGLVQSVQAKYQHRFGRALDIKTNLEGTVIRKHLALGCKSANIFKHPQQ